MEYRKIAALMGLVLAAATIASQAQTQILFETFSYPDGPLVGAPGSPWTTNSGTAGQQNVISGQLFLNDNETEDTVALFSTAVTFGSVTAMFDLTMDPADIVTSAAGDYITHFVASSNAFIGRVFMLTDPAGTGTTYRIGISTGASTPNAVFTSVFTVGTTYSLSLTYDLDTDLATLAVAGFGQITSTDVVDNNSINRYGFRQTTSTGDQFIDNLVVTTIPEPSTYMLLGVGLLFAAQRFRRSRK